MQNMTTYMVVAINDCEECNGLGWIYNEAWSNNPSLDTMSKEELHQFSRDHGKEEETCTECAGSGVIRREVTLSEALFALIIPQ